MGHNRVVTVARLDRDKGVDVLLDAAALVARRCEDLEVHVVGTGPQRDSLERQAKALGLGANVTFHGLLEDVADPLMKADVFVLLSRSEGLGIAVLEAMAASKPVIASAVGGLPEIVVDGVTGFLVRPQERRARRAGPERRRSCREDVGVAERSWAGTGDGPSGEGSVRRAVHGPSLRTPVRVPVPRAACCAWVVTLRGAILPAWANTEVPIQPTVLVTAPAPEVGGGVSAYVAGVMQRYLPGAEIMVVGRRSPGEAPWSQVRRLVRDSLALAGRLRGSTTGLLIVNPSLDSRSMVRDGLSILLAKCFRTPVVVFFHGWLGETEVKLRGPMLALFRRVFLGAAGIAGPPLGFCGVTQALGLSRPRARYDHGSVR